VPLAVVPLPKFAAAAAVDLLPFGRWLEDRLVAYNPFAVETQPLYGSSVVETVDEDIILLVRSSKLDAIRAV